MPISAASLKAKIDAFREEIGRNITFSVSSLVPCTLCLPSGYYDSINDTTTYFTCPVCDGQYYLPTQVETEVLARVHWVSDQGITATPGGKYFVGDCNVHIDPAYTALAESAQNNTSKVIVDGHDMSITKIIPLGAPSNNRTRLILSNNGSRPS